MGNLVIGNLENIYQFTHLPDYQIRSYFRSSSSG
jgi:hypothetical protein